MKYVYVGIQVKGPPTSFSPLTSTNVGISPKTFSIAILTL